MLLFNALFVFVLRTLIPGMITTAAGGSRLMLAFVILVSIVWKSIELLMKVNKLRRVPSADK